MIENSSSSTSISDRNGLDINSYYKIINESILKFNDILDSIIEDSQEKEKENQTLREELLQVIESKIFKLRDRELVLKNKKIQLLEEIDTIIIELDLQPSLFTVDSGIKDGYTQLIDSFNTTKLISSQIVLIDSYYSNIKNVYNENQNKLNQSFRELNQLYSDLGIGQDIKFKEIGLPSNSRISEIQIEIIRLKDIQSGVLDKINESKLSVIALRDELELSREESAEINSILDQLTQISASGGNEIKKLVQILYKLESINKELNQLKLKRSSQISKLSNTIEKDYIQLGIDSGDQFRVRFNKERDFIISNSSSVSLKLINCLLVESERLLELKKLKFKDQFDSKLRILENLWEQLCIPNEYRNLKSIINQRQQENSGSSDDASGDNTTQPDNSGGINLDIENNNSYYYNLETLELVNSEIEYLTGLLASMKVILEKVKRREWIKSEMKKFENSASDSNRFKGSSVRLLEEAKFRKTISKEFPKLTEDLVKELADWELQNNKRFFYYGQPYLDLMNSETERPDFDLLHLKLLTKKDHISESTTGQVAAVSYINIDNQQQKSNSNNKINKSTTITTSASTNPTLNTSTNKTKSTTSSTITSTPSKKPAPLIKRQSLSSIPTNSNKISTSTSTTTTTATTSPNSKLTKTLSSINFSTSISTSTLTVASTKSTPIKPLSSPSSLSNSTNSLSSTPSKPLSSSPSSLSNSTNSLSNTPSKQTSTTPLKKESSTKSLHLSSPTTVKTSSTPSKLKKELSTTSNNKPTITKK